MGRSNQKGPLRSCGAGFWRLPLSQAGPLLAGFRKVQESPERGRGDRKAIEASYFNAWTSSASAYQLKSVEDSYLASQPSLNPWKTLCSPGTLVPTVCSP